MWRGSEPMVRLRSSTHRGRGSTLGQDFDPRNNTLNAWRLILATGVIVSHSWPLTGYLESQIPAPVAQLLGYVWVDGFFTVSGFLITWSWFRNPRVRDYVVARGLRILPGLWVCLAVIAFVLAPISVAIQGGSPAKLLLSREPFAFVLLNSAVVQLKQGVGDTPQGIPWPGQWDGSLWTLTFEVACYVAVAVLGVTRLLSRQWCIPVLFALAVWWAVSLPSPTTFTAVMADRTSQPDLATVALIVQGQAARFSIMFLAGVLLYQHRNKIPARWSLVATSAVVVGAASFLPDYRIVAAIPLAYLIIVSGALIRAKRLSLRNDISYGVYIYAWPVQQLLVVCGLTLLHPMVFAVCAALATVPLAALSWFVVEKPALALKSRLSTRSKTQEAPVPA
ncbi:acyltransferase family protein [Mycolicibacterium sp. Dal123E01]|uniref:acyltransferase family protein n=1 Tax=Mycolicibacterium sp. Dal123E01 TaxID=3457578 RepID=UPI00403ED38F